MGKYYNQFLEKKIDLAPLGVERRADNSPYFCTPRGASVIGWAGVDGVHYCFIRGFGETVFAVSPMEIAPNYVRPLAKNFEDFLRLLLTCRDANFLEQVWQWGPGDFSRMVADHTPDPAAIDVLDQIETSMKLTPMPEPWVYMRELQDSFDYSKIKYTEEFYDPEMNENAPATEWAVYYNGTIYGHSGRDQAGTEIPVDKEFQYAGRTFLVPAVYSCAKGLVVDFCMRVDAGECSRFVAKWNAALDGRDEENLNRRERQLLELENPLQFGFSPEVTVNGKVLKQKSGSGICYIPGDPSEPETRFLTEHYRLDQSFAWSFTRACFPWKTARRPEIRSLTLTMAQEPVEVPGAVFEVSGPGDQIDLGIPGHSVTLTVQDYEPQIMDTSFMPQEGMEYPACYTMMTYTLSPTPEPDTFYLQDLSESDQPRPCRTEPAGCSSCEAEAIAIIGGADGPTAIILGAPNPENAFAACSSPHFAPPERIRWYPILQVTQYEPTEIILK